MKTSFAIVCASLVLSMTAPLLADSGDDSYQMPIKPCSTWGEIKSCYSDNPAPCCKIGKIEYYPDYAVVYVTAEDFIIVERPEGIRCDLLSNVSSDANRRIAASENRSWGAIKALYTQ